LRELPAVSVSCVITFVRLLYRWRVARTDKAAVLVRDPRRLGSGAWIGRRGVVVWACLQPQASVRNDGLPYP